MLHQQISFRAREHQSTGLPVSIVTLAVGMTVAAVMFLTTGYTVSDIPYLLRF